MEGARADRSCRDHSGVGHLGGSQGTHPSCNAPSENRARLHRAPNARRMELKRSHFGGTLFYETTKYGRKKKATIVVGFMGIANPLNVCKSARVRVYSVLLAIVWIAVGLSLCFSDAGCRDVMRDFISAPLA